MKTKLILATLALSVSAFADIDWNKTFGKELYNANKTTVAAKEKSADVIGIYFSAHWCPPCRAFSPKLVKAFNQMKKNGDSIAIVFASSDRSEDALFEYMNDVKMPWFAMKFGATENQTLSKKYGVRGIPMLIFINKEGKLITKNGRSLIEKHGAKAYKELIK